MATNELLVTEIISKSGGGDIDFFELYNYGAVAVDVSSWKWTDKDDVPPTVVNFPATSVQPGERVIFLGKNGDVDTFKADWGLPADFPVRILTFTGTLPGLGKADGFYIYDGASVEVAKIEWATGMHADGTSNGLASLVWDGVSPAATPVYVRASTSVPGVYQSTAGLGSPGDKPFINYSAATLIEAPANDGSVSTALTLTLRGETFVGDLTGQYSVSNVPAGLTAVIARTSATTATLTLTGNAASHANSNDIANLTVAFTNGAFAGNNATNIFNATKSNLAIDFADAATLTYAGSINESRAFDGQIAAGSKITITLAGDAFTGIDGSSLLAFAAISNVPAGLTAVLTRKSATTAELSFTGTPTQHADANDVNNLTVTFTNGAFTGGSAAAIANHSKTDLQVNFGDVGAGTQTFKPNGQGSDASTALALDANWMVVGDDEANVLRVYDRKGGDAVALSQHGNATEWNYGTALGFSDELDLEGGTRIGDTFYFTGSSSNKKGGDDHASRENLFSVQVTGTGADTKFSNAQKLGTNNLETLLVAWDASNAHTKGANYFGFATASAGGVVPENVFGFSIEGMTAKSNSNSLLLGLRAPQSTTSTRDKAVIVELQLGVDGALSGAFVAGSYELNLGGRGIRSIEKAPDGSYLILAGPSGSASTEVTHDFRLFRWDGVSTTPTELDVNLDTLRDTTGGSFETIVDVQSTAQGTMVQLLQDNGDTIWTGETAVSKDLPGIKQKFVGNWVQIGGDVTDGSGPMLAGSTPADNAATVDKAANIVLRFDEGVTRGTGNFVVKKLSDGSVVATIAATDTSQVAVAFNTVTINPAADLDGNTGYYVEAAAGTVKDHYGNDWSGLSGSTALNFTTGVAVKPKVLITEVNSSASGAGGGGDFFELYNYGSTAIDLSGWKWVDTGGLSSTSADAIAFASGTTLAAGEKLIVVNTTDETAFRTAWGGKIPATTKVVALGGAGLGGDDGVLVYDMGGSLVTAVNYKTTSITASDNTVVAPIVRSGGGASTGGHAGAAVGGTASGTSGVSAVWDGLSTTNPQYKPAVEGLDGAYAQTTLTGNIGSPGIAVKPMVLITEVNSSASGASGGGDFFELYNYGSTAIDLSGWKWVDTGGLNSTSADAIAFASGTTLAAGEKLIVVNTADETAFRTAWGGKIPATTKVVALGGAGLGGDDGVLVYDTGGSLVTAVNYKTTSITASDSTVIAPIVRAGGGTSTGGHAGAAVGGTASGSAGVSAIWDGLSTTNPQYKPAVAGLDGAYEQTTVTGNIGSPGLIAAPAVVPGGGGGTPTIPVIPPAGPGQPATMPGTSGNDTIVVPDLPLTRVVTGGGTDTVTGGTGVDTVVVSATLADVLRLGISQDSTGKVVINTPTGPVTMSGVERVELQGSLFAFDVALPTATSEGGKTGQMLALAYTLFGQKPDTLALSQWVHKADSINGMDALAQAFIDTLAPGIGNDGLVGFLFKAVTGVDATALQVQEFASLIGPGKTYATQGAFLAAVTKLPIATEGLAELVGVVQQLDASAFIA